MSDRFMDFTQSSFGKSFAAMLGLPTPPRLIRAKAPWAERPLEGRYALVGASTGAQLAKSIVEALHEEGAALRIVPEHAGLAAVKEAAATLKIALAGNPSPDSGEPRSQVLVFDASGISSPAQLREMYDFFQPLVRSLPSNGRVVILTRDPDTLDAIGPKTAQTGVRGFVRSLGKEIGKNGSTANLLEVSEEGDAWLDAPLRFFLSEHSAYVTGQLLKVGAPPKGASALSLSGSLNGKVALVTGAARGIGAAISEVLAREGAQVIGMDHPSAEGGLAETMARIGGSGLALDVTAPNAAERIQAEVAAKFGGLDVVVHNAGVTRDKMLRNMSPQFWDMVLNINLGSILRINEGLLQRGLNEGARIVCISSIGGIGGNAGQTNYASTKAGVIGYAAGLAATMAKRGGAINAVAPGFIETAMTAAMPLGPREVGRRINSLSQGGLPQDIAETVAFLSSPAAAGVNGSTLRVCGQNWMGA
jgi:3-oxoacyl-[acyl-carrier protein] reductase